MASVIFLYFITNQSIKCLPCQPTLHTLVVCVRYVYIYHIFIWNTHFHCIPAYSWYWIANIYPQNFSKVEFYSILFYKSFHMLQSFMKFYLEKDKWCIKIYSFELCIQISLCNAPGFLAANVVGWWLPQISALLWISQVRFFSDGLALPLLCVSLIVACHRCLKRKINRKTFNIILSFLFRILYPRLWDIFLSIGMFSDKMFDLAQMTFFRCNLSNHIQQIQLFINVELCLSLSKFTRFMYLTKTNSWCKMFILVWLKIVLKRFYASKTNCLEVYSTV